MCCELLKVKTREAVREILSKIRLDSEKLRIDQWQLNCVCEASVNTDAKSEPVQMKSVSPSNEDRDSSALQNRGIFRRTRTHKTLLIHYVIRELAN